MLGCEGNISFVSAYELYRRKHKYIFRLNRRTLSEWERELNIDSKKVLELLAWMLESGKIKDVKFV